MTPEERINDLLASNNRQVEIIRKLRAQLRKNTEQFQFYADSHAAKIGKHGYAEGTPAAQDALAKAITNRQMVADNLHVLTESY